MCSERPLEVLDEGKVLGVRIARCLNEELDPISRRMLQRSQARRVNEVPEAGSIEAEDRPREIDRRMIVDEPAPVSQTTSSATVRLPDAGRPWRMSSLIVRLGDVEAPRGGRPPDRTAATRRSQTEVESRWYCAVSVYC